MAKNRAIVPITTPNQNNAPDTLIDAPSLEKFISNARDHQLLKKQGVLFSKINKFFPPEKQVEMYRFLLTKSIGITDYNFNMKLFFSAATAINNAHAAAHLEVQDKVSAEIVTIFNNGLRMKCKLEDSEIKSLNWNTLTESVIDNLLKSDIQKAISLAQLSLTQRTKILLGSEYDAETLVSELIRKKQESTESTPQKIDLQEEAITAFLQACNKIAELTNKSDDMHTKMIGLKQATELYNIATSLNKLECRKQALEHMAITYSALGDHNKAKSLEELSKNILSENSNCIKKFGHTNPKILEIKNKIKTTHLDPVYDAASAGKWTNIQLGSWYLPTEQGVQGYIIPKSNDESQEDYNIKMALILESIILAMNNSENHDPTCAIIFATKYPEIIQYTVENHPEYFINSDILHICTEKADIKELQDLTDNNVQTLSGYKSHQEKAIIPAIEKRLINDKIIQTAKELATGPWNNNTQTQLLTLFDELKIGNNLGAISDSINIARILVIKAVIEAIQEKNSGNFAPFNEICKKYSVLINEIYKYHPEYLGNNKFILEIAKEAATNETQSADITNIVKEYHNIEVDQDTCSKLTGDINSLMEQN